MSKYRKILIVGTALAVTLATPALAEKLGLGRAALPEEIAAWDLDVSPDGTGLPEGSGSVEYGETVFSENCASCHGEFAEGLGNWPKLAGGEDTLARRDPVKTVGSYWPYLSTVWDYVHRSMPFGAAQTLSTDDVYAMTAYILYSNYLVDSDFVLSKDNFLDVEMPNADGFIIDDREEAEAHFWTEPCMENCKDEVEITMYASVLDVTPGTTEDDASAEADTVAEADQAAEETPETAGAAEPDPELVAEGEKVFRKCQACHQVGEGAKNRVGPQLNNVLGRTAGSIDDFRYSNPLSAAGEDGLAWTDETLALYLADPRKYIKGTRMSFAGLRSQDEVDAVIAYLATFAE